MADATPGTTTTSKGELTRRAILDAAVSRFGRDGYRSTSVADIARDAGVSGTLAYAYFPNKEALFLAAVDEDAAAVIREGVLSFIDETDAMNWRQTLVLTLLHAVQKHPLAERLLAGLEPEVTDRVLEVPALTELRKVVAQRLEAEQQAGTVRADIDPITVGSGIVTIILSLLMSVVRVGEEAVALYGGDIAAVIAAALDPPGEPTRDPAQEPSHRSRHPRRS